MNNISVSIIIPVYNPGELIHECISSLINQTFQDTEFIFINDESSDNTLKILKEYQRLDNRIVIIDQINQGISIARNNGLKIAKGEYIGFIDNDDYYELDFIENLYSKCVKYNLDIVVSRTIEGRDQKKILRPSIYPINIIYNHDFINKNMIINLLLEESLFPVWNKLYRKSLLEKFQVQFPNNRDIEEDCKFNLQAFNNANKVMFIDYYGYHYREVSTSESRRFIERDMFSKALNQFNFDYKNIYSLKLSTEDVNNLKSVRFINRSVYLIFICAIDNSNFKKKYEYIKQIITNPTLVDITKKNKNNKLLNNTIFDYLIRYIIINKKYSYLKIIILLLDKVYSPKISEIFRYININKRQKQILKNEIKN